jgi:hypothetical protein
MLRIQPIGYALLSPALYAPAVDWDETQALAESPWHFEPRFEVAESFNALVDEDYFWIPGDKPPLQHVSSALTIENALWQRNLLLQCGVGYEHVGMLVVYGQYSGKGASLQAVMPAVWASAEYGKLIDKKRHLLGLSLSG